MRGDIHKADVTAVGGTSDFGFSQELVTLDSASWVGVQWPPLEGWLDDTSSRTLGSA